jgi:hypothetical protein
VRAGLTVFVVGAALVVGCSMLVPIDDKPNLACVDCADDGPAIGHEAGDGHHLVDDSSDPPDVDNMSDSGSGIDVDMTMPDTMHPPPDTGTDSPPPPVCEGKADGYNWDTNDTYARCCGGQQVRTVTDQNCGVCGIKCNAANSETCGVVGGRYFCTGCVASTACWSKCCSTSFTPHSCAASDCAGNCSSTYCPLGTHCVTGGGTSSDYCSY